VMKIIGHRGAKGLAPENTIASLLKAIEHHVDEIECDIRITKDNVPVLVHDPYLSDPAGNNLKLADCSYAELKKHKADLPTLEEAIRSVNRQVPLMIELKPHEPTEPVVAVVRQFLKEGWQASDFLFVSFQYSILRTLHREFPEIELVIDELWSGVRASYRARRLGAKRINLYRPWVWRGFVSAMSRHYELYAFPLNNARKAKLWQRYGLAVVITDYPDRFEK